MPYACVVQTAAGAMQFARRWYTMLENSNTT